ncbi:MAG TPA: 5-(carboxyamino)imidazole ribonucleotide synthase [Gemmatimonadaceae bacterium]|nr:5-(carboxyamino)imidazole ribonucleotide synthase [Gemmatimonadaceae bacterium]
MTRHGTAHVVLPGATIGFLGGGQLGRMTAFAARAMGYDVAVLDPDPACPAAAVASRVVTAPYADVDAAVELARACDVVTLEIEQIPRETLEAVAAIVPLRPGVEPVWIVQDRARQKEWLRSHGFPVGPFATATTEAECVQAVDALGPSIVKSCFGGYDGRGQVRVLRPSARAAAEAWSGVGARRSVVEAFLDVVEELSVLVARRPDGTSVVFPPSRNHHAHGVLAWSVTPTGLAPAVEGRAAELARGIADTLGIEGLLAVELFHVGDGQLLVNELAPRPHNTFHHTERACETSQFEQLVRAICALPLGSPALVRPGAIANLLGDLWANGLPDVTRALEYPGVRLHLYGKAEARPGRKMGHLSASGETADAALRSALDAYDALGEARSERPTSRRAPSPV